MSDTERPRPVDSSQGLVSGRELQAARLVAARAATSVDGIEATLRRLSAGKVKGKAVKLRLLES